MKTLIVSLSLMVIGTVTQSQQAPDCLKSVERNIVSVEKGLDKLDVLASTGTQQQFGNTLRLTKTKQKSMLNSLEKCKISNPDYNFSEVDSKIKKVITRFESITGESNPATTVQTKTASSNSNVKSGIVPSCVKSLESKIASIEKSIGQLKEASDEVYAFQLVVNRTEPKVNSARKYLVNCKKENPNYDFSDIDAKISSVIDEYERLFAEMDSIQDGLNQAEGQNNKLKQFISYISIFPRMGNLEEYSNNYNLKDTENFLEMAKNDTRNLGIQNKEYQEAMGTIETSEFENRVYEKIDYVYAEKTNASVAVLNQYLVDFAFLDQEVFPNTANLPKIQVYIQKLISIKQEAKSKALSSVVVSQFHEKNINTVFFTNNLSLNPESAIASDFKTTFVAGENIMGIAYLDNSYHKIYGKSSKPTFSLMGSSNSGKRGKEGFINSEGSKAYIAFIISQDGGSYIARPGEIPETALTMEFLSKLAPREHRFDVEFASDSYSAQGDAPSSKVSGSFTIDNSNESNLSKLKSQCMAIRDKSVGSQPLPRSGMSNAAFEKELVAMFNSIGWSEKFTKAIIGSSTFGYKKNYLDQVTGRTLQVYMVSKKSDGGCMYQDFSVIQDKVGSDWGPFMRLSTGSQKDISCSKL